MRRVKEWWDTHFLLAEFLVALTFFGGLSIYAFMCGGSSGIEAFLHGSRSTFHASIARSAIVMMGFVFTGISVLALALSAPRLEVIRRSPRSDQIWQLCYHCLGALAAVAVIGFTALFVDTDKSPAAWIVILLTSSVFLSILRLLRVLWIVREIIKRSLRSQRPFPPP